MDTKKDIGKLFKAQLDKAEMKPSDSLWPSISEALDKKKKKRGFFHFFGGAFLVLLLMGISYVIFNDSFTSKNAETIESSTEEHKIKLDNEIIDHANSREQHRITSQDKISFETPTNNNEENTIYKKANNKVLKVIDTIPLNSSSSSEPGVTQLNKKAPKSKSQTNEQVNNASTNKNSESAKNHSRANTSYLANKSNQVNLIPPTESPSKHSKMKNNIVSGKNSERFKSSLSSKKPSSNLNVTTNTSEKRYSSKSTKNKGITSLDSTEVNTVSDSIPTKKYLLFKPDKKKEEIVEEDLKPVFDVSQWLISVHAIPTYYDFISKGTPFEASLSSGKATGLISMGYTALVNIPLSEKTTFRFGYRQTALKFKVIEAVNNSNESGLGSIFTNSAITRNGAVLASTISSYVNEGGTFELEQKINYKEIPFEFYHKIKEANIDVYAIGGISLALLGKSNVTIKTIEGNARLGETNFLKKTSVQLNTGLGFRYQIADKLSLDVEPTLRYQPSSFQKAFQNLHPVQFVVQTGLTFKL